jgi:hypothetical protein
MKNANNFRSKILEMKKKAFENAVQECSKRLGIKRPPIVSITETPCPLSSSQEEIAHIHPYERIICIWKKKLESIDLDTIKQVAAHEVAHLVSFEHDWKHAQAQAELEIGTWRPPPGVIVVGGKKEKISFRPSVRSKEKRARRENICSYYSCRKRTGLQRCKYCGKLFCEEHLKPKPPYLPHFENPSIKNLLEMGKWRELGHPCPPYADYLEKKKKEDLEKQWKALDRMRELSPTPTLPPTPSPAPIIETPRKTTSKVKKTIIAVAIAFIALLLIYLIFFI